MELGQVGQASAMVQMEMSQQHQVDGVVNVLRRVVERSEIGIPSLVGVEHVNTCIEDNLFVLDLDDNAGTPHFPACSEAKNLYGGI